jgi:Ala-tRNA(Pro) deacylase
MGAVPPFTFDAALPLVADPAIQANEEVVFNAGRLDRSIYMPLADYLRIAMPRLITFAA